jgi:hypothetical protein
MNRYRMFFAQTSTLPPKIYRIWKVLYPRQKTPTKCHVELEDNINMNKFYILGNIVSGTLFITL